MSYLNKGIMKYLPSISDLLDLTLYQLSVFWPSPVSPYLLLLKQRIL